MRNNYQDLKMRPMPLQCEEKHYKNQQTQNRDRVQNSPQKMEHCKVANLYPKVLYYFPSVCSLKHCPTVTQRNNHHFTKQEIKLTLPPYACSSRMSFSPLVEGCPPTSICITNVHQDSHSLFKPTDLCKRKQKLE